jgi:hypothetical protein
MNSNVGYEPRPMKRCKKCYNKRRRKAKKTGISSLNDEQRAIYDSGIANESKKSVIFRELKAAGFAKSYATLCAWMR